MIAIYRKRSIVIGFFLLLLMWTVPRKGISQEPGDSNDYQYALIEAVKQKNLGNLSEAVKLYRLVVKEKEDCAVAHYELGTIFLMLNQEGPAVQHLERSYELEPENKWFTMAFINALGAAESYDALEKVLKNKVKEEEEEVEWQFQMANLHAAMGKRKKAIRGLDRIEKERGFSERITLLKASLFEEEGKYRDARLEVEKVMYLFPEALQFRIVAAELSMKEGDEELAATYYKEILDIDSTNIFALTNLTDYYRTREEMDKSLIYLAGSFYSKQIDAEKKLAIMSYYLSEEDLIDLYPDELKKVIESFRSAHPDHKEGMIIAANFYIQTREFKNAYLALKAYIDAGEENYPAFLQAMMLANAAGDNKELMEVSNRALEVFPDSMDIRFFRAIALYELEWFPEIVENFRGVDWSDFNNTEYQSQSQILHAEAYYRIGDYAASDSAFEALIRDYPDNYMVLNNFSYYLAERGERLDDALVWSGKAVEKNPGNATFIDTYAWVLYQMGRWEEAERAIMEALEKGGNNDPEINEHAGDIQRALESFQMARSYYERAILLGGDEERLNNKLEVLREIQ